MNIQDYGFEDGKILNISMSSDNVALLFEQWNGKQIKIFFEDYWRIKSFQPIGPDIEELRIDPSGEILNEITKYNIDDGGTAVGSEAVIDGLNIYSFMSSSSYLGSTQQAHKKRNGS